MPSAGSDNRHALGGVAGHPSRRRICAGLRGERLVRLWFTQKHATEVIDKLNREINTALADPKIKAQLADLGSPALAGSPAAFGKLIADETEKWGNVIRATNIKPE